jgi:hypothetical protein
VFNFIKQSTEVLLKVALNTIALAPADKKNIKMGKVDLLTF